MKGSEMKYIYSPWRSEYFHKSNDNCVFCSISEALEDERHFVFYRDEICFGVMNKYPYTPGHILFVPHSHINSPEKLKAQDWLWIQSIIYKSFNMLYAFGARGINYGINIKQEAGAGIPEHLHLHLVPRYNGDTNFITSISDCRIYGKDFQTIYQEIKGLSLTHLKMSELGPKEIK